MSNYTKSKQTKRFTFNVNRDQTSKQAGSNTFTITTNASDGKYVVPQSQMTMTVKEALALQNFLNETFVAQ